MKIIGYDCSENQPTPELFFDRWYDRSWRSWGVRLVDEEGNQHSATIWVHSKAEALKITRQDFVNM